MATNAASIIDSGVCFELVFPLFDPSSLDPDQFNQEDATFVVWKGCLQPLLLREGPSAYAYIQHWG